MVADYTRQILDAQIGLLAKDWQTKKSLAWKRFPNLVNAWGLLIEAVSVSYEVPNEYLGYPEKWDPEAWRLNNDDAYLAN